MIFGDTIAAVATAPGRGGIAVVRVSGPEALAIAERLTGRPVEAGRVSFRRLSTASDGDRRQAAAVEPAVIDEAVVLAFRAPHSYTGEDVVEFQCHGGSVTPRRVLEACFAAGARLADRGEFTRRAFLNGRLSYDQAASVLDLIDAKTVRAAEAALEGLSGSKRRALTALYETALDLSTRLEHALDVDEGELPEGFVDDVNARVGELGAKLREALRRANEGHLLRQGALVVLAGPPNAGKSSLLNALLESDRAIVSDVPGTTRDTIEECLDLDGWPVRLVDTAGLRATADGIEAEGVRRSEDLLGRADLVLWLGEAERGDGRPSFLHLHAKCDLGRGAGLNVSAKTGEGLDELRRTIVSRLEEKVAAVDAYEPAFDTSPLLEALSSLATLDARASLDVVATVVRTVADRLGSAIGATYSSDLLENLFSRFCVGK